MNRKDFRPYDSKGSSSISSKDRQTIQKSVKASSKKYSDVQWENSAMKELTLKNDVEIKSHTQRDNYIEVETDNGTYQIYEDYDDAERYAQQQVKQDLDDNPEYFEKNWLQEHIYVTDTDKRILSDEESSNIVDNMSDDDIISESKNEEEYENAKTDKEKEKILDDSRESLRDTKYDEIYDKLSDPIEYFVNEQGIYTQEELLKQNFISIDTESASKDAVDIDGVAHFLSSYDGNEIELKSGSYAYRID